MHSRVVDAWGDGKKDIDDAGADKTTGVGASRPSAPQCRPLDQDDDSLCIVPVALCATPDPDRHILIEDRNYSNYG